jgi:16S rRNA (guanine1516-N2)-methyltransferase
MSLGHKSIAICYDQLDLKAKAQQLAEQLQCEFIDAPNKGFEFILHCSTEGLMLQNTAKLNQKPLRIDFTCGKALYRRMHGGGKNQPIAKAVGIKSNYRPRIIDATAGLGQDSFVLASLGCEVKLIERSPVIAALLQDALDRASYNTETAEIIARMHLHRADAESLIPQLPEADVIYLDPMFPDDKKSALAKKEMQILQTLLEKSEDKTLLPVALKYAKHRVVVKRPKTGAFLSEIKPSYQLIGSSNRFDIYVKP